VERPWTQCEFFGAGGTATGAAFAGVKYCQPESKDSPNLVDRYGPPKTGAVVRLIDIADFGKLGCAQ
jgi:hypothetical protein